MKILFLSNNEISTTLIDWLKKQNEDVTVHSDRLSFDLVKKLMPDIIISYNYRFIIKDDIIDLLKNKIINLHISLLPWNRSAHPNLWSILENTPKGVTIHLIDVGLDTGDILLQKEVFIDETQETLRSSYNILHMEIQSIFMSNWDEMKNFRIEPVSQKGEGSIHYVKDFNKIQFLLGDEGWDIPILKMKRLYNEWRNTNKN